MNKITMLKAAGVMTPYANGVRYRPDHSSRMAKIMGLEPYTSTKAGTLFFGCYNADEYNAILNHKGPRVLYWGGSDILYMKKNKFKFPKDVVHVVGCKRNYNELMKHNIEPLIRPVCELDSTLFKITPLGQDIYTYLPRKRHGFYGSSTIQRIAKHFPNITFILARYAPRPKPFPNAEVQPLLNVDGLKKIYSRCFASIRPSRHDGFPQSILELGMMGRATAWPHDNDFAVRCTTIQDYVEFIQREQARTEPHTELREKVLREVNNFDFLK